MEPFRVDNSDYSEPVKPAAILTETEARSAQPTGRVRYILAISLSLSILALVVVYLAYQ